MFVWARRGSLIVSVIIVFHNRAAPTPSDISAIHYHAAVCVNGLSRDAAAIHTGEKNEYGCDFAGLIQDLIGIQNPALGSRHGSPDLPVPLG